MTLVACNPVEGISSDRKGSVERIKAIATTTIVGEVVTQIGGEYIDLRVLLPKGADPHGFTPTPQDVARLVEAEVVFANGAGLETFLEGFMENAENKGRMVFVSDGIEYRQLVEGEPSGDNPAEGHNETAQIDPHTWTDPNNVILWAQNIANALSNIDPANNKVYQASAQVYVQKLEQLDEWIRAQVAQIPEENREIVVDHAIFGYFADRYGFNQVGAIVPGYSTLSEPSAQDLAALEDLIKVLDVKAVFVGNTVNPSLAERVAEDTGTRLVFLYTGSLSESEGEAGSYLDYVRYNVSSIVNALK